MNTIYNPNQHSMSIEEQAALAHDGFAADILNMPDKTEAVINTELAPPPEPEAPPMSVRDFKTENTADSAAGAVLDLIINLPPSGQAETAHLFLQLASGYEQLKQDGLVGSDGYYSSFNNPEQPSIEKRFAFLNKDDLGPIEHEHIPFEVSSQLRDALVINGAEHDQAITIAGITIAEAVDHSLDNQWVRRVSYMLSDNSVFVAPATSGYGIHESATSSLFSASAAMGILSRNRSTLHDPNPKDLNPQEYLQYQEQLRMQRSVAALNKLWNSVGPVANRAILRRYKAETDTLPDGAKYWLRNDFTEECWEGDPPNVHLARGETRATILSQTKRLRQTDLNEQSDVAHNSQQPQQPSP